jgi:type IV secretion system protein VirB10
MHAGDIERGITPVAGRSTDLSGSTILKRGIGAGALVSFVALVLWGTWTPRGTSRAEEAKAQVFVRQTAAFEPAREPPAPAVPAVPPALPALPRLAEPARPARNASDDLLENSRRAPLVVYRRTTNAPSALERESAGATGSVLAYGHGMSDAPAPRNDLSDRLRPTVLECARASLIPNRHLVVTQGTPISCVLETAMSSDVPGFTSCVVQRDVMSDSGQVVLMEKGTQIVGEYRGSLRRGSRRMFVLWSRAKTPTGVLVALSSPATDALGRSGFDGAIDSHFWERFGAALLLSVLDDAGSFAGRQLADNDVEVRSTQSAGKTAAGIAVERSIDIPPTLNKNQGEIVNIFVARDLDFSSVYRLRVVGSDLWPERLGVDRRSRVTKP